MLLAITGALMLASVASAGGGRYSFDGGTPTDQAQVRSALEASAFPWDIVPGTVTIHLRRGADSEASPGNIWIDANVLDAGHFAWAVVQHEYAHQVDFGLLTGEQRQTLNGQLGGKEWFPGTTQRLHGDFGSERFASTLTWAYWPSTDNAYRPLAAHDESAAMDPAQFRALTSSLFGFAPRSLAAVRRPVVRR